MNPIPETARLYVSQHVSDAQDRAKLTRQVIRILSRGFALFVKGNLPGAPTLYVEAGLDGSYELWSVCDNCGEFNVQKVNRPNTIQSVPYADKDGAVDAGTVAYRIAMVIKERPVDWSARWPDLVADFGNED